MIRFFSACTPQQPLVPANFKGAAARSPSSRGQQVSQSTSRRLSQTRLPSKLLSLASVAALAIAQVGIGSGVAPRPVQAAERINLRLGPLSQTVHISDLAIFADTGQVPPRLRLYESVLTPEVQAMLKNRLALDPAIGERVVEDVLDSPNGQLLLDTLGTVAPGLSLDQLRAAVHVAAESASGLSVLGVLEAIPQPDLEIDLTAVAGLLSQLNLSRLEGQALSSVLDHGLLVAAPPALPADVNPALPGPQAVSQRTLRFFDRDRARSIYIDIHRGVAPRPGPLVVLSHGFAADRRFLTYMAQHLASYGFTVVSIEHPGSNVEALTQIPLAPRTLRQPGRLLPATEFIDRPLDVSFVLDRLTWMNHNSSVFGGQLNTEKVVLIGHSLGGYTGLALAGATLNLDTLERFCEGLQPVGLSPADWLQCAAIELDAVRTDLADDRIVGVIAMNPLVGELFGPRGLTQVAVPTVMLTGTQDSVTPTLTQQLTPFTQLAGPKYLVAVVGGTHLSVGDPDNVNQSLTQVPFMPELQGDQAASLRTYLNGLSLSFVMQQTPQAERYRPFLSAAYAQQFSTETLRLRFAETLPDSVLSWMQLIRRPARGGWSRAFSWLHLETLENQDQLHRLQQQVTAYLQLEQISMTTLPLRSLLWF